VVNGSIAHKFTNIVVWRRLINNYTLLPAHKYELAFNIKTCQLSSDTSALVWKGRGTILGTIVTLKMTVFWDVAKCSLVEIDRRFRGAYYLSHQGATSQKTVVLLLATVRTLKYHDSGFP
jgi:hypothetical protein